MMKNMNKINFATYLLAPASCFTLNDDIQEDNAVMAGYARGEQQKGHVHVEAGRL